LSSFPREFYCRVPASLAMDTSLSPRARLLYTVLAAYADARTGRAYLRLRKLDEHLGCGRNAREQAQRELVRAGWLRLERKPAARGRWGSRIFIVLASRAPATAQFHRSGGNEQFFTSHSQVSPSPAGLPLV
jgi:Helix-turn-helix domain